MKSIEVTQKNTDKKITIFIDKIMWVAQTTPHSDSRIGLVGGDKTVITAETDYNTVLEMIKEAK